MTLNLAIGQGENTQSVINMVKFYAMVARSDGTAPAPRVVRGSTIASHSLGLSNDQLEQLEKISKKGKINVQRFKGLGEMNPLQLRETTMDPNTRRLVQLTIDDIEYTLELMDMLLAKKRSSDRKEWLEQKGNLAVV